MEKHNTGRKPYEDPVLRYEEKIADKIQGSALVNNTDGPPFDASDPPS